MNTLRQIGLRATLLLLLGIVSCSGAKELSPGGFDGGAGGNAPVTACSNDGNCRNAGVCIANRCVARQQDLGAWAIQIDPPTDSPSQLTEVPVGAATANITASPRVQVEIHFAEKPPSTAKVPTSAGVIVTVPSQIPGRPALSFQANFILPTAGSATLDVPGAIVGRAATVSLIPLPPSDQMSPPYTFMRPVPSPVSALQIDLADTLSTIYGELKDGLGAAKEKFTARVFRQDLLVSTTASTSASANSAAGHFGLLLPGGTGTGTDRVTLQLSPDVGTTEPLVTLNDLSLADPNLGTITLPSYAAGSAFQVPVHGDDAQLTTVAGATVRAFTQIAGGDARASFTVSRDALTADSGTASLTLIPGSTAEPRPYTLSVVPAAGSPWASQCISDVPAKYNGPMDAPALLRDVTLTPRAKVTGFVTSASGEPVEKVVVTATGGASPTPPCLGGPPTTTAVTNAMGYFMLALDPGVYQFDYDPQGGSASPRFTELAVTVDGDAVRQVRLPAPFLVDGDVRNMDTTPLPYATVRIFEPRCASVDACTTPSMLRAKTQTDGAGHYRAIVAAPGTN
jgi:hypothetical protein